MGKLSKLASALDMSKKARMQRAQDLGFDTNQTYYHGTNRDLTEFDLDHHGDYEATGDMVGRAIYSSTDPAIAQKYAQRAVREGGGSPIVYPLYKKMESPFELKSPGDRAAYLDDITVSDELKAQYGKFMSEDELKNAAFFDLSEAEKALYAKNKGYDSFIDHTYPQSAVLDETQVRSVNAAFDPAKKDSSNLLAGTAGAVVGGGALMQTDDADASFIGKGGGALFDDIAHAFAVKMKDSGVADEEIFKKTGMFQGADGQWRIEIDDSKRAYTPTRPVPDNEVEEARQAMESSLKARADWVDANKRKFRDPEINEDGRAALKAEYDALQQQFRDNQQKYASLENSGVAVNTMGEALDADVMRAYPEFDQVRFSHEDLPYQTRGAYGEHEGVIINRGMSPDKQESTILHEMQHAIQEREGFAGGASFAAHVNELEGQRDFALRKIKGMNHRLRDLVRQSEDAVDAGDVQKVAALEEAYKQTIQERVALAKTLTDSGINNPEILREQAYKNYKSVAGEVEARNVQFRQDMSPAERRQSFPPSTEDTARADQIIPNHSRRAESVRDFQQRRAAKKEKWRAIRGRDRASIANRMGIVQPAQHEFLADLANKFAAYNRWTESKPGLDFILPRAPTELVDKWSYGQPTTWGDDISAALDLM